MNCYSQSEQTLMNKSRALRKAWLGPLCQKCLKAGISADMVTLVGLLFGLAFAPLFHHAPLWALGGVLTHCLLDGLDGTLARLSGKEGHKGTFLDTVCDQTVFAAVTLTLMACGQINPVTAGAFLFIYTLVVVFAMVRNSLKTPYPWLFRPRFIFYALIPVNLYGYGHTLDFFMLICFVGLLINFVGGVWRIRNKLP